MGSSEGEEDYESVLDYGDDVIRPREKNHPGKLNLSTLESGLKNGDYGHELCFYTVENPNGTSKFIHLIPKEVHVDHSKDSALRVCISETNCEITVQLLSNLHRNLLQEFKVKDKEELKRILTLKLLSRPFVTCQGFKESDPRFSQIRKSEFWTFLLFEKFGNSFIYRSRACLDVFSPDNDVINLGKERICSECRKLAVDLSLKDYLIPEDSSFKKSKGRPKGARAKIEIITPDIEPIQEMEVDGEDEDVVDDSKEGFGRGLRKRITTKRQKVLFESSHKKRGRPPAQLEQPIECQDCRQTFTVFKDYKEHCVS